MFDKLEDLLIRFEELMSELSEPDVANDLHAGGHDQSGPPQADEGAE